MMRASTADKGRVAGTEHGDAGDETGIMAVAVIKGTMRVLNKNGEATNDGSFLEPRPNS